MCMRPGSVLQHKHGSGRAHGRSRCVLSLCCHARLSQDAQRPTGTTHTAYDMHMERRIERRRRHTYNKVLQRATHLRPTSHVAWSDPRATLPFVAWSHGRFLTLGPSALLPCRSRAHPRTPTPYAHPTRPSHTPRMSSQRMAMDMVAAMTSRRSACGQATERRRTHGTGASYFQRNNPHACKSPHSERVPSACMRVPSACMHSERVPSAGATRALLLLSCSSSAGRAGRAGSADRPRGAGSTPA